METHNKSILFLCQDYEDFKFLSEGSFGRVYSAMDRYTGDKVAIKVIKIEDSENEESGFPSFLVREIGTLKIASHPNIIELQKVCVKRTENLGIETVALVFPLEECTVREYIKRNTPLSHHELRRIVRDMCMGMRYLHAKGIMHRDVKPNNMVVDKEGRLKLIDFGLAKWLSMFPHLMTNEVMTLWYRPPELLLGTHMYSVVSDVWGMACTFFELAEGRILFESDCEIGVLFEIMQVKGTPTLAEWPDIKNIPNFKPTFPKFKARPPKFLNLCKEGQDLLMRMTQMNPSRRLNTIQILEHGYFKEPMMVEIEDWSVEPSFGTGEQWTTTQTEVRRWRVLGNLSNLQAKDEP